MPSKVIIDCDTGTDDALALLLALRSPEFDVLGFTCVSGNVGLSNVVNNTLRIVEQSGKTVPVYAGSAIPLNPQPVEDGSDVHGGDGLGGADFPQPSLKAEKENAIDFIIRTLMTSKKPMEWITLGPLTNVALALRKEPRIIEKVRLLTMMAGGVDAGNVEVMSEFNIYIDPEAAREVIDSPIPKMMVPLDPLFHGGYLKREDQREIDELDQYPWCCAAAKLFEVTRDRVNKVSKKLVMEKGAISPPDLLAVAAAIDPTIMVIEDYYVMVETKGEYTRGMTVVDRRKYSRGSYPGRAETKVVMDVDQKKYARLVIDTLCS